MWPHRDGSIRGCSGSALLRKRCAAYAREARVSDDSEIRNVFCYAAPTLAGADVLAELGRRQSVPANQSRLNRTGWNPAVSSAVLALPKEGVSLYGPTSTRVRLLGPGVNETWKPLSFSVCRIASATSGFTAITCQYDPGGNSEDATAPVSTGAVAGFS